MTVRGTITATDLNNASDQNTKVKDIMSDTSVHVVHKYTSAQTAAKMILRHNVPHIVIMNEGKIEGMISSIDFVTLVAEHTLDE